jgi:tellurite resistance protein TerC
MWRAEGRHDSRPAMPNSGNTLDWAVFGGTILATMLLQTALFGRGAHRISFREALIRTVIWIAVGLGFTGWVFYRHGSDPALTYLIAYLIEESLSIDNLFVFLVIFSYFGIGERHQQRILTWGIAGAILMRAFFIVAGTALLQKFHWMIYVFGAFLIVTGAKLALKKDEEAVDPGQSVVVKLARKYMRTTDQLDGEKFFTVKNGVRYATPLFLVLLVIEFTDVLFAVDSVPAVLAISNDIFIVYTSNIMAILGLRALYFLLAGMMSRFQYLDIGLAVILVFIGAKMLFSSLYKIPNLVSLGVIGSVLTLSVIFSLLRQPKGQSVSEATVSPEEPGEEEPPDPNSDPEPLARTRELQTEARKPASDARRALGEED